METLKMLSLFSGIGGIDLAAQWAGIETVAFCEIDKFCQSKLRKNFGDVPIISDIKEVNIEKLKSIGIEPDSIDIIAGGFPCQPFSVAGKRRGKEDDRYLWHEMFRVIQEIKPDWVVGENVNGFVDMGLDEALSNLESEGYQTRAFNIPACAVNAWHERKRVFIVAHARRSMWEEDANERVVKRAIKEWEAFEFELSNQGNSNRIIANSDISGLQETRSKFETKRVEQHRTIPNSDSEYNKEYIQRNKLCETSGETTFGRSNSDGNRQWAIEPRVGRVANGVPHRVDRLKALGNAVVPQQVYPFLKVITIIEKNKEKGKNGAL